MSGCDGGGAVLVTGAAGFIGFHVARRLLAEGHDVVGIDSLDPYYAVALKEARLAQLAPAHPGQLAPGGSSGSGGRFSLVRGDIVDDAALARAMEGVRAVVHFAGQAGVRHSLGCPDAFVHSNLVGFSRVLEAARRARVAHLVYASSSSVYGKDARLPSSERDTTDAPLSLYAATKKANEVMAHSYSHLFGLPTTGLRMFTVYGPWGRPDMAIFDFTRRILAREPITLFGDGSALRDFTFIDDVVDAVVSLLATPGEGASLARVVNIGGGAAITVGELVRHLERELGVEARIVLTPSKAGDMPHTLAAVDVLDALVTERVRTPVEVGLRRFVSWYREVYAPRSASAAPAS